MFFTFLFLLIILIDDKHLGFTGFHLRFNSSFRFPILIFALLFEVDSEEILLHLLLLIEGEESFLLPLLLTLLHLIIIKIINKQCICWPITTFHLHPSSYNVQAYCSSIRLQYETYSLYIIGPFQIFCPHTIRPHRCLPMSRICQILPFCRQPFHLHNGCHCHQ